jgi:hypothetical protein
MTPPDPQPPCPKCGDKGEYLYVFPRPGSPDGNRLLVCNCPAGLAAAGRRTVTPPETYRATVRPGESFPFARGGDMVMGGPTGPPLIDEAAEWAHMTAPVAPPAPAADPADDRCRACGGTGGHVHRSGPGEGDFDAEDCEACEGTGRQSVADGPVAVTGRGDVVDAELRALAEASNTGPWFASPWHDGSSFPGQTNVFSDGAQTVIAANVLTANGAFIAAANPARVLALLAERDALAERVASTLQSWQAVETRLTAERDALAARVREFQRDAKRLFHGLDDAGYNDADDDSITTALKVIAELKTRADAAFAAGWAAAERLKAAGEAVLALDRRTRDHLAEQFGELPPTPEHEELRAALASLAPPGADQPAGAG